MLNKWHRPCNAKGGRGPQGCPNASRGAEMTTISNLTVSDAWRELQARLQHSAEAAKARAAAANASAKNATTPAGTDQLTLSDSATASPEEVSQKVRARLDALLKAAGITSPLNADGRLAMDLSGLDRRELYAMTRDTARDFTGDEERAASLELNRRFDAMMSAATTAARGSGTVKSLYQKALDYLGGAGPEEKQSATWQKQKAALESGLKQLAADPSTMPEDNEDDPVQAYLDRITGHGNRPQSAEDLIKDARAALDLKNTGTRRPSEGPDVSDFAADTLSAIVLDKSGTFSATEVSAAKRELRQRANQSLLTALKGASGTGDFATRIMEMYSSTSAGERQAAGLSDQLYTKAMASYRTAMKLDAMGQQLSRSQDDGTASLLGFRKLGSI